MCVYPHIFKLIKVEHTQLPHPCSQALIRGRWIMKSTSFPYICSSLMSAKLLWNGHCLRASSVSRACETRGIRASPHLLWSEHPCPRKCTCWNVITSVMVLEGGLWELNKKLVPYKRNTSKSSSLFFLCGHAKKALVTRKQALNQILHLPTLWSPEHGKCVYDPVYDDLLQHPK